MPVATVAAGHAQGLSGAAPLVPGAGNSPGSHSAMLGCSVVGVEEREMPGAWLNRAFDSAGIERGS
jgi:hypothetical protein